MIINTTPHPINICNDAGDIIRTFPKGEFTIRLETSTSSCQEIDGIPTTKTVFGCPEGLPPFTQDTYYIVSQLVKNAVHHRQDLLVPAEVIRDEKGRIIGCRSLGR
jgi:hypothetical protein